MLGFGNSQSEKPAPVAPELTDDGHQGALHAQAKGTIVFTSAPVAANAPANTAVLTSMRLDTPVHHRAFYDVSALRAAQRLNPSGCKSTGSWTFHTMVQIGNQSPEVLSYGQVKGAAFETATTALITFSGTLLPEARILVSENLNRPETQLLLLLSELPEGEHELQLWRVARCSDVNSFELARGKLTLTVDTAGKKSIADRIGLPEAFQTDKPADVQRLQKAAQEHFHKTKVLHFRLLNPQWRLETVKEQVYARSILAATLVEENGRCTVAFSRIRESFINNKTMGTPDFEAPPASSFPAQTVRVPCGMNVRD